MIGIEFAPGLSLELYIDTKDMPQDGARLVRFLETTAINQLCTWAERYAKEVGNLIEKRVYERVLQEAKFRGRLVAEVAHTRAIKRFHNGVDLTWGEDKTIWGKLVSKRGRYDLV